MFRVPPLRVVAPLALALVTFILVAGCDSTPTDSAASGQPAACVTATSLGRIAGRPDGRLCAFRGIPYALPPTGPRRFRPPEPAAPWKGTLAGTDGTKVCPQTRDESEDYPDGRGEYTDEDCLDLNVWTPAPDRAKRPVIFFIHGGAGRLGSGNEPRYDGTALASRGDAVVVTINYRLGIFGWSELGQLDPSLRGSGNNGLRDQIEALRWVHDHIADFGGDPGNVTAVGQSEGAFSISALLSTDHPEQLFHRAVLQSGTGAEVHSAGLEKAIASIFPVRTMGQLTAMSTSQILDLQAKMLDQAPGGAAGGALYFGPYVDGTLVRAPLITRVQQGDIRGIDLMLGTTRDEMNYFAQFDDGGRPALARGYDAFFPTALQARRPAMEAVYRRTLSGPAVALAMFTDQGMRIPAIRLAEAQSRWRPVYLYEFDWSPPKGLGAVHTIDLPFVFGTLRFAGIPGGAAAVAANRGPLAALSARMVDAWTSFARSGNPNSRMTVRRPPWPAYRAPARATMMWDLPSTVADAPRDAQRAAWDGYSPTSFNG